MNIQDVNDMYGRYIWAIARRYHTGIWSAEDVFQEMLLQLFLAMKTNKLPTNNAEASVSAVKGFIITKIIDILRIEKRRYTAHFGKDEMDVPEPASRNSSESYQFELKLLRELLFSRLSKETAEFIYELAFPSPTTVEIAIEEQIKLRMAAVAGSLKMYVRTLKITPKHVSESRRRGGHSTYTKQMVAKMRGEAQKALRNYFEVAELENVEDVIDDILGIK